MITVTKGCPPEYADFIFVFDTKLRCFGSGKTEKIARENLERVSKILRQSETDVK